MADNQKHWLDKARDTLEKALDHEKMAEFSTIAAQTLMEELEEHPEAKGTKVEKDYLKRHKKHINAAKWRIKQIEKLHKKYEFYMKKAEAALTDKGEN